MTQKLTVKIKGTDGSEIIKKVEILRSWQDSAGGQIFLHHTGVYGYKDGAPVRSMEELSIISAKHHLAAAQSWWHRAGEKLAAGYYEAIDVQLAAAAGDFSQAAESDSDLDMVLYWRAPVVEGAHELLGPFSWMELFSSRPDWWGQAKQIGFDDWQYIKFDDEQADTPQPESSKALMGGAGEQAVADHAAAKEPPPAGKPVGGPAAGQAGAEETQPEDPEGKKTDPAAGQGGTKATPTTTSPAAKGDGKKTKTKKKAPPTDL